ncbi:uncharacterized protein LOC144617225 isoform X2 [Panthera onca]
MQPKPRFTEPCANKTRTSTHTDVAAARQGRARDPGGAAARDRRLKGATVDIWLEQCRTGSWKTSSRDFELFSSAPHTQDSRKVATFSATNYVFRN